MRKLVYLFNASFDGYVEGTDGKFDWSEPDEEVHRFFNDITKETETQLYGRRLYETMLYWQAPDESFSNEVERDFARAWKKMEKVVFSRTLEKVEPGHRLVRGDVLEEVTRIKAGQGGMIAVAGPTLAHAVTPLIDEFQLVIHPVITGGGKSYFPKGVPLTKLKLLETKTFRSGCVYVRYARA